MHFKVPSASASALTLTHFLCLGDFKIPLKMPLLDPAFIYMIRSMNIALLGYEGN